MNYPWVAGSFPSRKASQKIRNVLFLFENVHCSNPELFTKTFCLQSAFGRRISEPSVLPGVDLNPEPWCLKPTASPSLFCTEGESDLEDVILLFQRFHGRLCPETPLPMWHVERLSSSAMQGRAHERLSAHSATQGRRCPCPCPYQASSHIWFVPLHFVLPMWYLGIPGRLLLRDTFLSVTVATQHQHQLVLKLTWAGGLTASVLPTLITPSKLLSPCCSEQSEAQLTLHLLLNLAWHFETRLCYS